MFASIARRYDLANSVLSAGLHHAWKRRAVAEAGLQRGERVLDAGAGTGDLARLALATGARVTAVDVSLEMMAAARMKRGTGTAVRWVGGDIVQLPFRSGSFDAVLTAFALRHPTRLDEALKDLRRVLVPGGRLVILEFARPVQPWAAAYRAYAVLIPFIGGWLTGDADAYAYLVESIRRFPPPPVLAGMIRAAGFTGVSCRNLTGGIVAIHTAVRPG